MTDFQPGLYFAMPEDQYHAIPALGSSSVKQLLTNPVRYWAKSPHGKAVLDALGIGATEPEEPSLAQMFGSAVHTLTLEPHLFDAAYVEVEDPPEEYLTTKASIRAALERTPGAYVPMPSAQRPEHVMAARRAGLKLIEDWKADQIIRNEGRKTLSRRWMATMRLIGRLLDMERADLDGRSVRAAMLSGGHPEVTILWIDEETGAPCKARIDYMHHHGMLDLKTYAAPDDDAPLAAFLRQISRYAYELQAIHYRAAWEQLGALIEAGQVFGPHDPAWVAKIRTKHTPTWRWLAVQTIGMPEVDWLDLSAALAEGAAEAQRRQALTTYARYVERFGLDQPWVSTRGRIVVDDMTLEASGLARRMMERGEERWREQ